MNYICFKNGKELQFLYLHCCKGLTFKLIHNIATKCNELTELNLTHTQLSNVSVGFLVHNLSKKVTRDHLLDEIA